VELDDSHNSLLKELGLANKTENMNEESVFGGGNYEDSFNITNRTNNFFKNIHITKKYN